MIRHMIAMSLERHAGFDLVGQAEDLISARNELKNHEPDVMILDLHLRGDSGLNLVPEALTTNPKLRILAVTASQDGAAVRQALDAGILGFVSKGEPYEIFQNALEHLAAGLPFYSPAALKLLRGNLPAHDSPLGLLTAREKEILRESASGLSVKEIASKLNLSANTVKTHRKNVLQKLELHDVVSLTRFAVRHGLVTV